MWWEIYRRWTLGGYVRRIRKHGWTGSYIYADGLVPFSYSIGFWESANAPEVIMFGASPELGNGLLGEAHRQLKAGELKLADEARWVIDWEGGPALAWRAVHPSQVRREHFNIAIWYRERQGHSRYSLEAYQLFVGDQSGVFPWEEGYDLDYRPQQKELYLPYFGPVEDD
jgi:hypothetical protein